MARTGGPVGADFDSLSERIRVLHVDDDRSFLDLSATFLERKVEAIEVETAETPSAGLDILAAEDIDCVISDFEMPEMSGLEFLDAVRTEHPDIPFILFTGKGSEEIASKAITRGVDDYLRKQTNPVQYTLLANRVLTLVDKDKAEKRLNLYRTEQGDLYETIRLPTLVVDDEADITLANERVAEVLGTTIEEMRDWSVETLEPEIRRVIDENSAEVISDGRLDFGCERELRGEFTLIPLRRNYCQIIFSESK